MARPLWPDAPVSKNPSCVVMNTSNILLGVSLSFESAHHFYTRSNLSPNTHTAPVLVGRRVPDMRWTPSCPREWWSSLAEVPPVALRHVRSTIHTVRAATRRSPASQLLSPPCPFPHSPVTVGANQNGFNSTTKLPRCVIFHTLATRGQKYSLVVRVRTSLPSIR